VVLSPPFFFKNIKMAINVNTVYTTVLTILNKEQRGYLTPYEFNNIANQVQLQIFEKFFEDYNQYIRMPKTDVEFASRMDHTREEFQVFEKTEFSDNTTPPTSNVYDQPSDLYRFGSAFYTKANGAPEISIMSKRDYKEQTLSPLLQPSLNFPIATYQQDQLTVYPALSSFSNQDVEFNYIRKPKLARWGYSTGSLNQFVYDPTVFNPTSLNSSGNLLNSINPNLTNGIQQQLIVKPGDPADPAVTIVTANSNATGLEIFLNIGFSSGIEGLTISNPGTGYTVGDKITFEALNASQPFTSTPSGGTASVNAVCTLAQANFNGGSTFGSTNFEISDSMQTEVILEVLKYAGVIIRDPQIIQAVSQELAQDEVNSKR
jgi:hypothetical protein